MRHVRWMAAGAVGCALLASIAIGDRHARSPVERRAIVVVPGNAPPPLAHSTDETMVAATSITPVTSPPLVVEPMAENDALPEGGAGRTAPPDAPDGGIGGSTQAYAAEHPGFMAP